MPICWKTSYTHRLNKYGHQTTYASGWYNRYMQWPAGTVFPSKTRPMPWHIILVAQCHKLRQQFKYSLNTDFYHSLFTTVMNRVWVRAQCTQHSIRFWFVHYSLEPICIANVIIYWMAYDWMSYVSFTSKYFN